MDECLVLTADADDEVLVELLLGDAVEAGRVTVTHGAGRVGAGHRAATALFHQRTPILLAIESESLNPGEVANLNRFYEDLLGRSGPAELYRIVIAEPELEVCLLQSPRTLAELTGREVDPLTLTLAEAAPRRSLALLAPDLAEHLTARLLDLSDQARAELRATPLGRQLTQAVAELTGATVS